MKIYLGGVNAVGKTTVAKETAKKLGISYIHATKGLMDYLGISNDYEKLRALTQEERDTALGVYVESLLSIGDSFLLDGHYLGLVRGEVNRITGSWITGFDRLILVSASTDDVWNRINNDERDRSLFPKNLSETEIKDMLKIYQYDTGNEFRRLGEIYDKKGFEVLNSENNLDEAVKNLVEYIEKYK